jgi:hypothetical protein
MDNKKLFERFKKRVAIDGAAKVAVGIGMRTTQPIAQWLHRGSIPFCRVQVVEKYLRGGK